MLSRTTRSSPRLNRRIPASAAVATEGFLTSSGLGFEPAEGRPAFPQPLFSAGRVLSELGELLPPISGETPENTRSLAEHWNCPTATVKQVASTDTVKGEQPPVIEIASAEAMYNSFETIWLAPATNGLKKPRRPPDEEPQLDPQRAKFMGAALLSFDFDYGDLVRWLGGEYTNQHRDWDALQRQMDIAMEHPQRPGYPGLAPEIAMKSFREGVPLEGHYSCTRSDFEQRIEYNNHKPLEAHLEATREKFGQEEAKSFHIAFPRFIAFFMLGAMINPISWVVQKGKGRLIIDASTKLHTSDTGAPNSYIPKPGIPGRSHENPPVYYGSALRRHLTHIYNLRIQYPKEDILQHTDDIDAAFRRVEHAWLPGEVW